MKNHTYLSNSDSCVISRERYHFQKSSVSRYFPFISCLLAWITVGNFLFLASVNAQELPELDIFRPQPSGQSVLARLYREKSPAVVYVTGINIDSTKKSVDEFFVPSEETKEERTVGTGFIIHEDGYIITNAHAVMRSVAPEIELIDGRRLGAEIVAIVPEEDLALLKVEPSEKLTVVKVEPEPEVVPGDTVVAIGCPHGLKHTLSYGIISATNRTSVITDIPDLVLRGLLQTDVAINPGSSGGPWFNLYGNVIGVTVSKRGDSDNIAFGISLETIQYQFPRMLHRVATSRWNLPFRVIGTRRNDVHRARLSELNTEFAKHWNLAEGDTICAVNGQEIRNPIDFYTALLSQKTGDTVQFTVRRATPNATVEGETLSCEWTLTARDQSHTAEKIAKRLPIRVRTLTEEECDRFNLRVHTGLMIEEIDATKFQNLNYIPRSGDVLARVNCERPKTPEHLAEILDNISEKLPLNLVILRLDTQDGNTSYTRIDINNWKEK
ncbi:MAG: trypsin-like peptidase domain-containing protein [Planctomycetia bacterium]|nr:trypsin-like peptidase domain-containing protein [Planctomycetia bacterium]